MSFRFARIASAWMPGMLGSLARPRVEAAVSPDVLRWKRKAISREATIALRVSADRIKRLHRRILDPRVLEAVMAVRAGTLEHRSGTFEARSREAIFQTISPAYRREIENESSPPEAVTTALQGLTWWVPLTRPHDEVHSKRYVEKQHFPYRTVTQTRELALGGLMLDVGANNGRMSIPRVVLGDVRVAYCAEPEPLNYACLVRNVRDNHLRGLVLPDQVAIGAENTTVRLELAKSAGGHSVLGADEVTRREIVEVASVTLDTWIERLRIDLDDVAFVKVDVQGSELAVLRGAPRLLARPHVVWQMEIDPSLLRKRGHDVRDLFAALPRSFTHFVELGRDAEGQRMRSVFEIGEALGSTPSKDARTDVLLFTAAPRPS